MLIPKKNRLAVYAYLFKEGVLVAKKDFAALKHPEIDVPNLQVIKLMQSLKSRNYVKENFNWQYYYYYLTNEGIEYLREFLHLPSDIVPVTLKKTARTAASGGRPPQRYGGDRDRPRGPPSDKKVGPGPDYKPEFRGGFGRSRGGFRGEGREGGFRGEGREGGFRGEGREGGREFESREGGREGGRSFEPREGRTGGREGGRGFDGPREGRTGGFGRSGGRGFGRGRGAE